MVINRKQLGISKRAATLGIGVDGIIGIGVTVIKVFVRRDNQVLTDPGDRVHADCIQHFHIPDNRERSLINNGITITHRYIGLSITKGYVTDGLIHIIRQFPLGKCVVMHSGDHVLDAGNVPHVASCIDNVNVGVSVGHKQEPVLPVIVNLGNLVVGQHVLAVQWHGGQCGLVKLEQAVAVQVVDFVACIKHILNVSRNIIVVNLPCAGGACGNCQNKEQKEH